MLNRKPKLKPKLKARQSSSAVGLVGTSSSDGGGDGSGEVHFESPDFDPADFENLDESGEAPTKKKVVPTKRPIESGVPDAAPKAKKQKEVELKKTEAHSASSPLKKLKKKLTTARERRLARKAKKLAAGELSSEGSEALSSRDGVGAGARTGRENETPAEAAAAKAAYWAAKKAGHAAKKAAWEAREAAKAAATKNYSDTIKDES